MGGGYNLLSGKDHFNFSSGKYSHMLDYNKLFIFIIFFVIIIIIIRQGIIDKYNNNKEIFIFLLSTRSGKWSLLKCFSSLRSIYFYLLFWKYFFLVYMNCLKMWKTEKFNCCISWHQLLELMWLSSLLNENIHVLCSDL